MTTDTVALDALSPAARKWYLAYLAALDAKDIEGYGAFLDEDCEFGMKNDPPVRGRIAVLEALAGFFAGFDTLDHEPGAVFGNDQAFCGEAANRFRRLDGSRVTVHGVGVILRGADGLATRVRIYGDYGPVFAPA